MMCRLALLGSVSLLASAFSARAQSADPVPLAQAVAVTSAQNRTVTPRPVASAQREKPARRRVPPLAETRVASATKAAIREPVIAGFVNAAQIFPFSEGALYQAITAPERVTDIALEPGEALISVAAGDTARWVIGDTSSGTGPAKRTHVLVKPFASGLSTNLVITTDRRSYHLALVSTPATAMVALSWSYPQGALIALKRPEEPKPPAAPALVAPGLQPDQLRFDYRIVGDRPAWRPLRAFDDGRQTWVEFPASIAAGEAPPLFVIGQDGAAELVNYRVRGRFYVVDRIFETAELRLGGKRQQVVRITRGARKGRS